MTTSALSRTAGLASIVGGAAWVAACLVHNAQPQGCIDDGCVGHAMRDGGPVDGALFVVAGLMLAVSGVCLLLLVRSASRLGRTGVVAGVAGSCGCALLAAALVVSTVNSDWNGMPGLVVPGVTLLAVGLVLVAVVVLRAQVLPTWSALVLLATALLVPFANEQTSRILWAVPFGLAWAAAGTTLVLHEAQPAAPQPAGRKIAAG